MTYFFRVKTETTLTLNDEKKLTVINHLHAYREAKTTTKMNGLRDDVLSLIHTYINEAYQLGVKHGESNE
jgi:hypothetical protein